MITMKAELSLLVVKDNCGEKRICPKSRKKSTESDPVFVKPFDKNAKTSGPEILKIEC